MSVRRKLFLTIALFIVGMGLVFAFATQVVIRGILDVMIEAPKRTEIAEILAHYDAPERIELPAETSILFLSRDKRVLYKSGAATEQALKMFGIKSPIKQNGQTVAFLYYHDPDVDYMSKLRMGVLNSTRFLLLVGTVIFVLISLVVAYLMSKRLTRPLRALLPVIDRLGQGEFGVQAPVLSRDEHGKVAAAFNKMSSRLQQDEEVRRNLVADVAHELRTPLTIIRGKLDLFQQHGEPIEPQELLPLQDDLIRLTRLVEDLHQLSLAEAKQLPLDKKPTDLSALLHRIVERVAFDAESKEIKLSYVSHAHDAITQVDSNRITQVFLNLLINAIRYTPEGGQVSVVLEEQHGALRTTITDTGFGIAPEHLPFLFNRFYRTDSARDRNSGGMGLGLAIVKEFVLAHDGTITVQSEPGQGTTFTVVLPFI
ncbi:two-component system sensor histidine kinase BaeS [Tumebacillus sp. BK434]|uniref:sensor histidine kinase n=1 Tax=Tumebacillus sp. BK434 TaxID=2512169 RepID=UPI001048E592|nr:ATP-binding protein [Tumebacillus sp. BK434]TCP58288.1 two-component system sensor histidine kinase BaeS [Tumebacillus sp. BK434]